MLEVYIPSEARQKKRELGLLEEGARYGRIRGGNIR